MAVKAHKNICGHLCLATVTKKSIPYIQRLVKTTSGLTSQEMATALHRLGFLNKKFKTYPPIDHRKTNFALIFHGKGFHWVLISQNRVYDFMKSKKPLLYKDLPFPIVEVVQVSSKNWIKLNERK